jgi:tetratricopeptide (TPR) repeat protein
MNQGTITQFRRRREPVIRWRGKRLPIAAACELAIREHQLGNFQGVVDLYHLVLATNPRFAEGHNNRGAALHQLKRYDAALASYDQALALKPDYANAHANRAATLRKLSRPDEALASYNRAIALNPNHAEAYNNRGVLLQEMRRHDDARASYERAIALNPDHAVAHNNLGTVLVSKGDMAGAEKMYLKAIQLKPDFPDPLFNLTNIRNYQSTDNAEGKISRPCWSGAARRPMTASIAVSPWARSMMIAASTTRPLNIIARQTRSEMPAWPTTRRRLWK